MKDVTIDYYLSNNRHTARFISNTAVYEECLQDGRYIGLYWSAGGQVHRENVVSTLPYKMHPVTHPVHSFELEIDGQSLHNRWSWVSAIERPGERPGTIESVIELKHNLRPVTIRLITKMDGTSIMTRRLDITNTGSSTAALSGISPLSGMLWQNNHNFAGKQLGIPFDDSSRDMYALGYLKAQDWGEEGNFVWEPLKSGVFKIEHLQRRPFGSPYFITRNEVTGAMFFIALAWSSGYYAEFKYDDHEKYLSFKTGPSGLPPLRVISPGETVSSPEVHIGAFHCDMDCAVSEWYRHLRTSVIPKRPADKKMYTVAGRVIEEPGDWILREVDIAAKMGVEAFMVDAGWYGRKFAHWTDNRGDWFEGDFLPGDGISTIRDYTHGKGMIFGIWMEPEAISSKSEIYSEHPKWRLGYGDGINEVLGPGPGYDGVLDLSNPEAAEYMEESIVKLVRDFKVDFHKLDYNNSVWEGAQNLRDGYAENESWRHMEVLYKVYDRLVREYPDVMLENCASGGGRNDLGMLSRFHYCCESDWSIFPYSIRAINGLTLFIPPESICYYHNHIHLAHTMTDIDTHLRLLLFAIPVFVGFGAQNTSLEGMFYKKTREYIELAKTFCRSILADKPIVYHHTPDIGVLKPAEWCVLEYGAADRLKGYAGVFRLDNSREKTEYTLRLRGVDESRNYIITRHNQKTEYEVTGEKLANEGLHIRLENANTSELILYRSCKI